MAQTAASLTVQEQACVCARRCNLGLNIMSMSLAIYKHYQNMPVIVADTHYHLETNIMSPLLFPPSNIPSVSHTFNENLQ